MEDAMNIEGFFVRTTDSIAVRKIVEERINAADDAPGLKPDWGLEQSYDAFIVGNPQRKVAMSKPRAGWIAAIESKEVLDFALLQRIGQSVGTDVIAYQISDSTGGCGYAVFRNGRLEESNFDEDAEDPLSDTRKTVADLGIPFDLVMFREAAQDKTGDWEVIQKST
jgi:hypothetical protein